MFGKKLSKYLLHFSSVYLSKGCSVETVCFALCETIYCAFLLWWQLTYLLLLTAVFPSPILAGDSQILAQYYQFTRLGFEGHEKIIENCMENATVLREGLERTGHFDIASKDVGVPLVAVSLKDCRKYTEFGISESWRRFGWIIPAYSMPPDAEHIAVLQVVNREHFSRSLMEKLISHIEHVMKEMDLLPDIVPAKAARLMATNSGKRQEEITRYWRRLMDSKRAGVCWVPLPPCSQCFACYLLFVL